MLEPVTMKRELLIRLVGSNPTLGAKTIVSQWLFMVLYGVISLSKPADTKIG